MSEQTATMGHGRNQRSQIKMTDDEVTEFLAGRRSMTWSTINRDGSIHSVAMWYGFLDGKIAIETKTKAQKVKNLLRDPRATVLVEDGETYDQLRGVSIIGTCEFVDDRERQWALGVSVFERYTGAYSDEMAPFVEAMLNKRSIIVLNPTKVVTWDHRKLGLPSMSPQS